MRLPLNLPGPELTLYQPNQENPKRGSMHRLVGDPMLLP